MNKRWNAAVSAAVLSAMLAACTGAQEGAEPPASPKQEAAASPSPSASPSPKTTPSPSPAAPSPTPTAVPSPTAPSPSPSVKPPETAKPTVKPTTAPTAKPTSAPTAKPSGDSSRKSVSWYYMKKKKGEVPGFPAEVKQYTANQKVAYVGTGKKVYLTFDTGGPLGDVDKMLKVLKDNGVKANYFLAGYNVKAHPDFLKRLVNDGHLVANHTMSHKDMTTLSDAQVQKEIEDYAKMYQDITGKPIQPFFRFPYGTYSMHLLDLVSDMGYTSVFWSTAMRDWEPRANGPDDSYNDIMNNLHDGNIILMHQGSEDNIEALDRIIKGIKKEGYQFGLLTDFQK